MPKKPLHRPFPVDLPGVTAAWLAKANACSPSTLRRARAGHHPISAEASSVINNMTNELAQELVRNRPRRGMIPYWGRLAIADMAARGFTYAELMQLFGVGRSTVSRAIQGDPRGYQPMSGQRVLTDSQKLPLKSSN